MKYKYSLDGYVLNLLQFYDNSEAGARLIPELLPGTLPNPAAISPTWFSPVLTRITKMERVYQRLNRAPPVQPHGTPAGQTPVRFRREAPGEGGQMRCTGTRKPL